MLPINNNGSHRPIPVEILRCPITGETLCELSAGELLMLNQRIGARAIFHRDDSPVQKTLDSGLETASGRYVYRIDRGVVALLSSLAIVAKPGGADKVDTAAGERVLQGDKQSVQRFYDEVGWTKQDGGRDFVDASKWEDLRPVASDYIRDCHSRVARHLQPAGQYLLDVASGPVQYDEYLEYSRGYQARVCIDISLAALRAARDRLGHHGVYILGDITNLPLADNVMHGVVSLHTIYHVPADEQAKAFRELHRVLAPGHSAVVVYNWRSRWVKAALLPAKLIGAPVKLVRSLVRYIRNRLAAPTKGSRSNSGAASAPKLYFHAHPYRWFAGQDWGFPWEIHVWRSVSIPLLRAYVHRWLQGQTLLKLLFRLEESHPRLLGRLGAYPLIVIQKPMATPQESSDERTRSKRSRFAA
jgi:SAM-dependent methyltransferase